MQKVDELLAPLGFYVNNRMRSAVVNILSENQGLPMEKVVMETALAHIILNDIHSTSAPRGSQVLSEILHAEQGKLMYGRGFSPKDSIKVDRDGHLFYEPFGLYTSVAEQFVEWLIKTNVWVGEHMDDLPYLHRYVKARVLDNATRSAALLAIDVAAGEDWSATITIKGNGVIHAH